MDLPLPTPKVAPAHLTPLNVILDGPLFAQVIVVGLLLATLAAAIILAMKLAPGRRLAGGSPFLSGLRIGGPAIGLLGACWSGMNMAVGMANIPVEPTLKMFSPGLAESFIMVGLGFFAGAVAVVAHWLVDSRIDRQVLGA